LALVISKQKIELTFGIKALPSPRARYDFIMEKIPSDLSPVLATAAGVALAAYSFCFSKLVITTSKNSWLLSGKVAPLEKSLTLLHWAATVSGVIAVALCKTPAVLCHLSLLIYPAPTSYIAPLS
jgi:hypothetical protein